MKVSLTSGDDFFSQIEVQPDRFDGIPRQSALQLQWELTERVADVEAVGLALAFGSETGRELVFDQPVSPEVDVAIRQFLPSFVVCGPIKDREERYHEGATSVVVCEDELDSLICARFFGQGVVKITSAADDQDLSAARSTLTITSGLVRLHGRSHPRCAYDRLAPLFIVAASLGLRRIVSFAISHELCRLPLGPVKEAAELVGVRLDTPFAAAALEDLVSFFLELASPEILLQPLWKRYGNQPAQWLVCHEMLEQAGCEIAEIDPHIAAASHIMRERNTTPKGDRSKKVKLRGFLKHQLDVLT